MRPYVLFLPLAAAVAAVVHAQDPVDASHSRAEHIAVVYGQDRPEYRLIVEGIRKRTRRAVKVYDFRQRKSVLNQVVASLTADRPVAVVAVGGTALKHLQGRTPRGVPMLFAGVLRPEGYLDQDTPMPGIRLDVDVAHKVAHFLAHFPKRTRIGLVYDPDTSAGEVIAIRAAAKRAGATVVARAAKDMKEAFSMLDEVVPRVDAFLVLADSFSAGREAFARLRLLSLRHRVPVIGLGKSHVEQSALLAHEVDWQELGLQAGELADEVVAGQARSIVLSPRRTSVLYDSRSAAALKIPVPKSLKESATDLAVKEEEAPNR